MLTVTVEIDALAELGQGAKEAVAMRLESLGGVRVLEVREVTEQMRMDGWRGRTGGGTPLPATKDVAGRSDKGAGQNPPTAKKEPMRSCFTCAARYGEPGTLIEGKLAYGVCRINRQPVRNLYGVCKQWSERR